MGGNNMKIINMPRFILGCINITLFIALLILVILQIRPVRVIPFLLICCYSGICCIIESMETKKQRQQRAEELREMAKIFGWDKDDEKNE
jgi:hypothetical protein